MNFKKWLFLIERGTKITATGLNSGGMAQHGKIYRPLVNPFKNRKKIKI